MEYQDCIEFANKCGTTFIATIDENRPRVRPLALQFADERGFYSQTESVKNFYKQIRVNNAVELCFYDPESEGLG